MSGGTSNALDFLPLDRSGNRRFLPVMVCSKQLFREALNHPFDELKQWEIREVNDIMNHCVTGWHYFADFVALPLPGWLPGKAPYADIHL